MRVGLPLDDVRVPARGNGDPSVARQEEGLRQDDAADLVVLVGGRLLAAELVLLDAPAHLGERRGAVADAERFPRQRCRQNRRMREHAAAHDEVVRTVELEEEQLAGVERLELGVAAGLPEVDLVEYCLGGQQLVPVTICDTDEEVQGAPPPELPGSLDELRVGNPCNADRIGMEQLCRTSRPPPPSPVSPPHTASPRTRTLSRTCRNRTGRAHRSDRASRTIPRPAD